MSSQPSNPWSALPGDEPDDVVFTSLYGVRTIELNRPKKLNTLNGSMIRKIAPRLLEWERSDMANVVVMKGAGDKAFCAGGDVAVLAQSNKAGAEGRKWSTEYFGLEYKLDHLIATYQKPYIAFLDGITMGGGVGLSVHAPLRIATERTVFAMPETTIGFFPDVGASFFLSRLPGAVGTYLALTSDRLTGADVFYTGIATHYLHSTSLPRLESRLAELRFKDYDDLDTRLRTVNAAVEEYCTGLPYDQPMLLAGELRKAIDRCFGQNSVADIVSALQREAAAETGTKEWAAKTLDTLHQRSPTAVHVSLRQMRIGRKWSLAEAFGREHQMAAQFMRHPDFTEGVTARLLEKRTPQWQPATLEDISPTEDVTKPFFEPSEETEPLELLNDRDYDEYPFRFGVPAESDVKALVQEGGSRPGQVVNLMVKKTREKQGVKEVTEEIVARKTQTNDSGLAEWVGS